MGFDKYKDCPFWIPNSISPKILGNSTDSKGKRKTMSLKEKSIRSISQEIFDKIIEDHENWLLDPTTGKQAILKNIKMADLEFPDNLLKMKIINCLFSSLILDDCIYTDCEFIDVNFTDTDMNRTEFVNCLIMGSNFSEASCVESIDFDNCRIYDCNFELELINKSLVRCLDKTRSEFLEFIKEKEKQQTLIQIPQTAISSEVRTGKIQQTNPSGLTSVLNSPSVNFIKESLETGFKFSVGTKISKIIDINVKTVLKKAKVPKAVLDHEIVTLILSLITPQILRVIIPFIPKLNESEHVNKAIDLACVSAASKVSTEVIDYVIKLVTPISAPLIKQLNSPELKKEIDKIVTSD